MTTPSNLRRNPINAAISWRTMDTEAHTISEFDWLPGIYGYQIKDKPQQGSVEIVETNPGSDTYDLVSTAPAEGQARVDYVAGIVIHNIADDGHVVDVDYNGGGTNLSIESIRDVLSSAYLLLSGGTMTGDIIFNDNVKIKLGTLGEEAELSSLGANTLLKLLNGDFIINDLNSLTIARFTQSRLVGIKRTPTTYQLEVNGDSWQNNGSSLWLFTSDNRTKVFINEPINATEKINELVIKKSRFNAKYLARHGIEDKERYSVEAQEFEKIFPDDVKTNRTIKFSDGRVIEGLKSIDMHNANMLLIKAFQEQSEIIEDLKIRVEELESK